MTKNVLIFFSFKKHKTGYYNVLFDPLKSVENDYELNLEKGSLKDLRIEVIENQLQVTESLTGKRLDEFDAVTMELWTKAPQQALAAATYMARHNVAFMGHEKQDIVASSKIGEMVKLSDSGLPLPRTFISSRIETLKAFKKNPPIAYPLIAKAASTFGGQMNYLVHSYKELRQRLFEHPEQYFVLQEFIPNDCDYRVLIMGEKVRLVMRRTRSSNDTHLNNTSAGANGEIVPIDTLTDQMLDGALKAANLTGRNDFAGVDILIDKNTGKHYFLEVNEAPAIQTGAHTDIKIDAYMRYIVELTKEKRYEKTA